MKHLKQTLLLLTLGASLLGGTASVQAQNRGNFDPAEFQKRMLERLREQFEVKDDAEWKLISEHVTAVFEAQRATRGSFGGFGGGRPPGGGGDAAKSGDAAKAGDDAAKARTNRGGTTREPNVEAEALQKAIEAKAPTDEIKTKLAAVRDSRKAMEAKLDKAQHALKELLSVRQEAQAVMVGLLK